MAGWDDFTVTRDDLYSFCIRCLEATGAKTEHAKCLTEVLVMADYRGHYSHGLNRIEMYLGDLVSGMTSTLDEPEVVRETVATALVDGKNVLGPVVGRFCMDLAIQKAKESGIGWVTARASNHFGIAGWYELRAVEQGLIGMAFCNTSPNMVPTRAREKTLGTNAMCVAAPGNHGDSFVLDMATTDVAQGKVEMKHRLGQDLPHGWGVDETGKASTDTHRVLHQGGLLPLGGTEDTSGYKGFGLAMMVEIFCGILSGSDFGPFIRHWSSHSKQANLGQCFVAIDPGSFAPGCEDRLSQLMDHCRGLQPAEGETEVLVAGDPERKHMSLCDSLGGIPYHRNQMKFADDVAAKYNVEPLRKTKRRNSIQESKSP
ncbi:uncharacterized oxidoreductase YjmC-like [Haliotis asinina]|uniref:uncharacterized oxidoreductase YjmC-like n=1 Tax=Haliotis asinina TaxID=109174 RepID=UPI0035319433